MGDNLIMDVPFPVLYILMRDDLASMNPGKAMAQASHASNAFLHMWDEKPDNEGRKTSTTRISTLVNMWKAETSQGFGTVLTLAVNESDMRFAVEAAERYGFFSGIVHDPTYPLRDGATTHFIPVDTCAFVFVDKNDPIANVILGNFPLHP